MTSTSVTFIAALFLASSRLVAQDSAEIGGFISDPQKAVVPGAVITMTMTGTAAAHKAVSDASGRYTFAGSAPPAESTVGHQ